MKRGTKSVLFGVHQFLWHPFTVWRAWRHLYKENPSWVYLLCIIVHDLGYWGKPNMDGPEGQTHPEVGARIAKWIAYRIYRLQGYTANQSTGYAQCVHDIVLCHSTHYAKAKGLSVSSLYLPDKACVLFDPPWFYLLRARLSGELQEYVDNENKKTGWKYNHPEMWLANYRQRIHEKVLDFFEREENRKRREAIDLLHRALALKTCECDICASK